MCEFKFEGLYINTNVPHISSGPILDLLCMCMATKIHHAGSVFHITVPCNMMSEVVKMMVVHFLEHELV